MVITCNRHTEPMRTAGEHRHEVWEIIYTLSGTVTETVGSETFSVRAGDVTVVPPRVTHSRRAEGTFTDMYVQAAQADLPGALTVHDQDGSLLTLMGLLHKQMLEKEYDYLPIADGLYAVICRSIRKFSHLGEGNSQVRRLKNALYEHISDAQFDLAAWIACCGYTENYLRSCFKRETGMPPLRYLTHLRIAQAKSMLLQEDFVSVGHVAAECGFADALYFSTCFKKHAGLSPTAYRETNLRKK